jgi:hypothetical protein
VTTATSLWSRRASAGCYGFRIGGVEGAGDLLVDAPPSWPQLALAAAVAGPGGAPAMDVVGPRSAQLPLHAGGWMEIERDGPRITVRLPRRPDDEALVHPYLAPGAAVLARWQGREAFHAGAVLAAGGAWAILGGRESGKSSTLGWLAAEGHTVLADDLLVLDGQDALAGPRCIDLRPDAAARLEAGEPLGVVGTRERWRLRLGPAAASVPLRGWVELGWGDEVAVEPVRGAERLTTLIPHRSVRLEPPRAGALMELASLPLLRLLRPRRWDALPHAAERLLAAIG